MPRGLLVNPSQRTITPTSKDCRAILQEACHHLKNGVEVTMHSRSRASFRVLKRASKTILNGCR